jgi:hypothetical protein
MRAPRRHAKPRRRIQPPPGKSERFWNRKAGEADDLTGPVVGGSLPALEAKLDAIDAELARAWPVALDCSQEKALICGGLSV